MIRYTLSCGNGHGFDSWFRNADAFDALAAAGQLACPICGAAQVEKTLMAPTVRPARNAAADPGAPNATPSSPTGPQSASSLPSGGPAGNPAPAPAGGPHHTPAQAELEKALIELRRQVEANSDYVGLNFAAEARRIHYGDAPERAIYGEARPEDARQLIEDGVPVAPLPFLPRRKTN
ncbi:MAG: DUF1178 family protein [Paracoccaceae bacterium]